MTISTQELTTTLRTSPNLDEAAYRLELACYKVRALCVERGLGHPGQYIGRSLKVGPAAPWPRWERSFSAQWARVFGDDVRYEDEPGTASRGVAIFLNPKSFHPPMGLNAALRSVTW